MDIIRPLYHVSGFVFATSIAIKVADTLVGNNIPTVSMDRYSILGSLISLPIVILISVGGELVFNNIDETNDGE